MAEVREFRSTKDYERWLREVGTSVRIVTTTSSKRWSPMTGFMGDAKTITVTYEPATAIGTPSTAPRVMAVIVAPKPVRFLAAPDVTKFSSTFAPDGEAVELVERQSQFAFVRRPSGNTGWLPASAVRVTGEQQSEMRDCPRCAETIKRAAKVCRFCGYDFETIVPGMPPSS